MSRKKYLTCATYHKLKGTVTRFFTFVFLPITPDWVPEQPVFMHIFDIGIFFHWVIRTSGQGPWCLGISENQFTSLKNIYTGSKRKGVKKLQIILFYNLGPSQSNLSFNFLLPRVLRTKKSDFPNLQNLNQTEIQLPPTSTGVMNLISVFF